MRKRSHSRSRKLKRNSRRIHRSSGRKKRFSSRNRGLFFGGAGSVNTTEELKKRIDQLIASLKSTLSECSATKGGSAHTKRKIHFGGYHLNTFRKSANARLQKQNHSQNAHTF